MIDKNNVGTPKTPPSVGKRKRGRPAGSYQQKPSDSQQATFGDTLEALSALSPIEGLIEGKTVPSRRFSPGALNALREKLFCELLEVRPLEREQIIAHFTKRAGDYHPQGIERYRKSQEALDACIEEAKKPEEIRRRIEQCEWFLVAHEGSKGDYSKAGRVRWTKEATELRKKLAEVGSPAASPSAAAPVADPE